MILTLGLPVAGRSLRPEAGELGHLAQDGVHCRSGRRHPVLHHLPDAWPSEGCHMLPLWVESHAVLGFRRGLHARSLSQHVGTLGARCPDRVGRLPPGDLAHRGCRGGGAAAVLLPEPRRRMASRKAGTLSGSLWLTKRMRKTVHAHIHSSYKSTGRCRALRRWGGRLLAGAWAAMALASVVPSRPAAQENRVPVPRERLWSVPGDGIARPDVTDRVGRFERDASGSYNIYDRNGTRVGVGKPRSDGTVDLYDTRGRRGLEVSPERPR